MQHVLIIHEVTDYAAWKRVPSDYFMRDLPPYVI